MQPIVLGSEPLDPRRLAEVAHARRPVAIDLAQAARVEAIRRRVDALLAPGAPNVYGVNTGFGALAEVRVQDSELARLQVNLLRSHSVGVGAPYDEPTTRAMMLLRANVLLLGTSGVHLSVPSLLLDMLNRGVHPVIPSKGSVGASGDLAPLAHLALVLIGEGEAVVDGVRLSGADALSRVGLAPITLAPKEGLALINGTQAMTADLALVLERAAALTRLADLAGAISLDALLGTVAAFDPRIHAARPHPGQQAVAANIRRLLAGSAIGPSHAGCGKVQDPYSLRCMPQVHGATRDALDFVQTVVTRECNAATDNPLVFFQDEAGALDDPANRVDILSGGNFHGQPIAIAADLMAIALAELANISERRVEQLVNPSLSSGLPPFLARDSGLNSGFMIAQVTAASLVSENKVLAHPASVDSIPSSANREDHVSMGTFAARKAHTVLENVEIVIAVELLCGLAGLDLRRPLTSGPGVEAAWRHVRARIPMLTEDRALSPDVAAAVEMVRDGSLLAAVEADIGPLS